MGSGAGLHLQPNAISAGEKVRVAVGVTMPEGTFDSFTFNISLPPLPNGDSVGYLVLGAIDVPAFETDISKIQVQQIQDGDGRLQSFSVIFAQVRNPGNNIEDASDTFEVELTLHVRRDLALPVGTTFKLQASASGGGAYEVSAYDFLVAAPTFQLK